MINHLVYGFEQNDEIRSILKNNNRKLSKFEQTIKEILNFLVGPKGPKPMLAFFPSRQLYMYTLRYTCH